MKAPDKICVAPHQISDYDLDIQDVGHNGAVEYIRKDALMEIINVEKTRHTERRSIEGIAACHALNDLIKQLELYDIK